MADGILRHNRLGMRTWYLDNRPETRLGEIVVLRYELEQGIIVIDTTELYSGGRSERLVGEVVELFVREEIYLVSKVLPANAGRRHLEQNLGVSLKVLQTDYLGIYLYHWRDGTPLQGTVDALETAAVKGRIKSWGVSNFDLEDMQKLLGDIDNDGRCRTSQALYHLGSRGIEVVLELCQNERGIPTIAYCPLAQTDGLRSGLIDSPAVGQVAQEQGINGCQVLLCFALTQENMVSIPHTGKLAHVRELTVCLQIKLSDEWLTLLNHAFPVPECRVLLDVR